MCLTTSLSKCPLGLHGEIVTLPMLDTNLFDLTIKTQNSVLQHYGCWSAVACLTRLNSNQQLDQHVAGNRQLNPKLRKTCTPQDEGVRKTKVKCTAQVEAPTRKNLKSIERNRMHEYKTKSKNCCLEVYSQVRKMNQNPNQPVPTSLASSADGDNRGQVLCWFCKKPGHYASHCWENPHGGNFHGRQRASSHGSTNYTNIRDPEYEEYLREKREKEEATRFKKVLMEVGLMPQAISVLQPQITGNSQTASTICVQTPAQQSTQQNNDFAEMKYLILKQQEELEKIKEKDKEKEKVAKKILFSEINEEEEFPEMKKKKMPPSPTKTAVTKMAQTAPVKRKAQKSPEENTHPKKVQATKHKRGPYNTGSSDLDAIVQVVISYGPKPKEKDKENRLKEVVELIDFSEASGEIEEVNKSESELWEAAREVFNIGVIDFSDMDANAIKLIMAILNSIKNDFYVSFIFSYMFINLENNTQNVRDEIAKMDKTVSQNTFRLLMTIEEILLRRKRKNWHLLSNIIYLKACTGTKLGKKWLKIDEELLSSFWPNKKGAIYALVNTRSKKIYIGRTNTSLSKRWQRHHQAINAEEHRKLYRYMKGIGVSRFFMIPLEFPDLSGMKGKVMEQKLDWHERQWIMRFRHNTLNSNKGIYSKLNNKRFGQNRAQTRKDRLNHIQKKRQLQRKAILLLRKQLKLREMTDQQLIEMILHIQKAGFSKRQVQTMTSNLKKEAKTRGIVIKKKNFIAIPNLKPNNKEQIKAVLEKKLCNLYGNMVGRYISHNIRIVSSNIKTLRDIICNRNKFILKFYNQTNCGCSCSNYHSMTKNDEGHILMKASQLSEVHGKLKKLLSVNSNTGVGISEDRWVKIVTERIQESLQKLTGKHIDVSDMTVNMQQNNTYLKENEISRVLTKYKGLLFTELDKNAYQWAIMCPCVYLEKLHKHFDDDKHYLRLTTDPTSIEKKVMNNYNDLGLNSIVPFKKINEIGTGYILPKDKDIKRVRPIVSYFKHGGRKLGRLIARSLSVLLRKLTNKEDLQLNSTKEAKQYLISRKKVTKNHTFIKLDIKNQFTELDKTEVEEAIVWALLIGYNEMGIDHFSLARRRCDKKMDGINRKDKNFIKITIDDIAKYVDFELNNAYFKIGKSVYKQDKGLPMGGLISACLADITSLYKERKNSIKNDNNTIIKRFQDDILIIQKETNIKIAYKLIKKLKKVYGPSLELELEDCNNNKVTFLDYEIFSENRKLGYRPKNISFNEDKGTLNKIRFPEYYKECDKEMLIQIARNQFKQTEWKSCNTKETIGACTNLALEFYIRGYPIHLIRKAIYMSELKGEKDIMELFKNGRKVSSSSGICQPNFRNILSENLFLLSRGPKSSRT